MTLFLTSDQHYGHGNVIKYSGRPYHSVGEMNAALIANHNNVVNPEDEVWHLGDFALDERLVAQILPKLNGTHTLIAGNHDRCHPCHSKGHAKAVRNYLSYGFNEIFHEKFVDFGGALGRVLITHMPTRGTGGEHMRDEDGEEKAERYADWRPTKEHQAGCQWLLHGHVHEAWKVNGNMINMGVDQWNYTPVSIEQLQVYLNQVNKPVD